MIKSFQHKGLRVFYETGSTRGIRADHAKRLARILQFMDRAMVPDDLNLPGWRLHPLKEGLAEYWSLSVSGNWRVVFDLSAQISNWSIIWITTDRRQDMPMHNPPHPGETLLMDVLPELGISVAQLARHLGFARPHLSRVLHGHAPISPDLAVRLERAGIGKARTWLGVQTDYDLWQAEHREQPLIKPIGIHADAV